MPVTETPGSPPSLTTRSGVDIAELQGHLTTQDKAMVQVASNFNCLENGSRRTAIDSGHLVDMACSDGTQGPAAVFGTTTAYLHRCHFYRGGQSLGHAVNLLEHTSAFFGTPEVGKLTLTGQERLIQDEAEVDEAAAQVCVGLHIDCPLMFGRSKSGLSCIEPKCTKDANGTVLQYPLIDQVLSASINRRDFGVRLPSDRDMDGLNRALLRASYEGVYLAAIMRSRRKLFLTLVGGGCFCNPVSMIVEEILRAHRKWSVHPACVLEDVTICLFSQSDERAVKDAMRNAPNE